MNIESTSRLLHCTIVQCIRLQLGMHYIPLIDPGVSGSEEPGTYPPYDEGLQMHIFIKNSTGLPFVGKVSLLLSNALFFVCQ